MNILIPMAGLAQRFINAGYTTPKPLIKIDNKTLIEHTLSTLNLEGHYIFVTRDFGNDDYNKQLSSLLKELCPNSKEICVSEPTSGSVETCLKAIQFIDNDEDLIITNCDQRTEWDSQKFIDHIKNTKTDGCLVTYTSNNPKNSFAKVDEYGNIEEVAEKNPISDIALIGLHYWTRGSDFVSSAKKLMNFSKNNKKEPYISETYNYLIKENKKINIFHLKNNEYISLGTPNDLAKYQGIVKEYRTNKPKTIFCDIDGTILKHVHKFSDITIDSQPVLSGVIEKFNEWDSQCHRIILCTARKESARELTELQLKKLGIAWDQLIMGCSNGERVLINDKLNTSSKDRAISINVITNEGFTDIDWEKHSL